MPSLAKMPPRLAMPRTSRSKWRIWTDTAREADGIGFPLFVDKDILSVAFE